jgi:phage shock protein C
MKKLYRSQSDVIIAGICGGLADYIGIDPTIIRLLFLLFFFVGLGGFWLYIILWVIMPQEPIGAHSSVEVKSKNVNPEPQKLSEPKQTEKK